MSNSESISISMSKEGMTNERSLSAAAMEDASLRKKRLSISDETIGEGNVLLGTYKVTSGAIEGGMGSVWRVHHQGWDIDLAMKRPLPRFFTEGSERRKQEFIRECENWINLGLHPNIVSCYYVREIGGVPTIFSEWMENKSLRDRIRDGMLYEGEPDAVQERLLRIALQAQNGLAFSHETKLIHQDVKPGNLLLTNDWEAKVADFGLAKAQSQLAGSEGAVSGGYTPEYCPPEQTRGIKPEAWMDVYAWALTVLEMYAGKRCWESGAQAKECFEDCCAKLKVPMPEGLREILEKCIKQDTPEDFSKIETGLEAVFKAVTGKAYKRPGRQAASDTAASLNNRALSFLDLGKEEEALELWQQALSNDVNCVDAIFNRELYLVRKQEKYDFEAIEEINRNKAAKESGAAKKIEQEWDRSRPLFPSPKEYCLDGHAASAVLIEDYLYFTVGDRSGVLGTHREDVPYLIRVRWDRSEPETYDRFEAVTREGGSVRKILVAPDGKRAVLLLNDCSACLYDLESRKVILKTDDLPKEKLQDLYECLNEFQGAFSPDGRFLVLFSRDSLSGILILKVPSLETAADLDDRFVCFTEKGEILLRSKEYPDKSLFPDLPESNYRVVQNTFQVMSETGDLKEVYRFNAGLEHVFEESDAHEFRGLKGPAFFYHWGWNEAVHGTDKFWMDERFERREITNRLFTKDNNDSGIMYYDPENGLLFTRIIRGKAGFPYAVWDMNKQECLYTEKNDLYQDGPIVTASVLYDKADGRIVNWISENIDDPGHIRWSRKVSAPGVVPGKRAPWRISRIVTVDRRLEEEEEIRKRYEQFMDLFRKEEYKEALAVFNECRQIPGFTASEEGQRMENAVDAVCVKKALLKTGRTGTLPEWPQYSVTGVWSAERLADGTYAFTGQDEDHNPCVRVFRPDGALMRTVTLRGIKGRLFIRDQAIYVFDSMLEHLIFDFDGILLRKPPGGWPVRYGEVKNSSSIWYPRLLDVDRDGIRILYGLDKEEDAYGNPHTPGIWQTDLVTGRHVRVDEYIWRMDAYQGYGYLSDGTIVIRRGFQAGRHDPKTGRTLKTWKLGNRGPERINVYFTRERDRAYIVYSASVSKTNWRGYDLNDEEIFREEGSPFSSILFVPGGRFAVLLGSTRFEIRDMKENTVLYARDTNVLHEIKLRPDGREMYVRANWKDDIMVYRLEYDYELPDGEQVKAPGYAADLFDDPGKEPVDIVKDGPNDRREEEEQQSGKIEQKQDSTAAAAAEDEKPAVPAETETKPGRQEKKSFLKRLFEKIRS